MKHTLVILAALFVAAVAFGYQKPVGALVSLDGGSVNSLNNGEWSDSGVAANFVVGSGNKYSAQCFVPACLLAVASDSGTATCAPGNANTGAYVGANQLPFPIRLDSTKSALAMIQAVPNPDGGAVICQIYQELP
jgi:hypothetical protein